MLHDAVVSPPANTSKHFPPLILVIFPAANTSNISAANTRQSLPPPFVTTTAVHSKANYLYYL